MSTTTTPYGVIVTETEDSISFRLPSWLTDDERARIRSGMDEWWVTHVVDAVAARGRRGGHAMTTRDDGRGPSDGPAVPGLVQRPP